MYVFAEGALFRTLLILPFAADYLSFPLLVLKAKTVETWRTSACGPSMPRCRATGPPTEQATGLCSARRAVHEVWASLFLRCL